MKMKFLSFILVVMLLIGVVAATDTAITAVTTLSGQNSYSTDVKIGSWQSLPASTNTVSLLYDGAYNYLVAVNSTSVGTTPTFNVVAGNNPPSFRSGIGNLAVSLTVNTPRLIGPLESARFINTTGYLKFSTTNVTTGTFRVIKVKRQ
jgi:hypothetical protein